MGSAELISASYVGRIFCPSLLSSARPSIVAFASPVAGVWNRCSSGTTPRGLSPRSYRNGTHGSPSAGCSDNAEALKLVLSDKCVSVFGSYTSASREAVLAVFEKNKSLYWYPTQKNPTWSDRTIFIRKKKITSAKFF